MPNTTVVGAGLGGLATAIRLQNRGHQVTVFEQADGVGGKMGQFEQNGFRFDTGPSLFTMPQYVDELLAFAEDPVLFDKIKLDTVCHYFWNDGTTLSASSNTDKFDENAHLALGIPRGTILKVLKDCKIKYDLSGSIFLENSLHKWKTWFNVDVLKALMQLPRLDIFSTMNSANQQLCSNPKLLQFLGRFATYNGSDPYQAPGILNMIPHFEHNVGTFYPTKGIFSIAESLYLTAKKLGVQFNFQHSVDSILVEGKEAKGVVVSGKKIASDYVVCNMDVNLAYPRLLKNQKQPKRILNQEKSTSAIIFYWGIAKSFDELDLHNILFSNNYPLEFKCLSLGKITDDPTLYINITSKITKTDAPQGMENWFVMINAPADNNQNWDEIVTKLRKNVINKINKNLNTKIEENIVCERILTPPDIEKTTFSHKGALYGTSSNSPLSAFMRHPNFSQNIKKLFFCGGSVHPGGGIPLALLSAKIVDKIISDG